MVNILPKFLEELGVKMGGGNVKTSFGSALGGIVGTGFGLASGVAAGIGSGAGLMGTLGNAVTGAYNGGVSGAKGKNVADFFKNEGAVSKANRERATAIARQGGGLRYAGAKIESAMGITNAINNSKEKYSDTNKLIDNVLNAQAAEIKDIAYGDTGIKFGTDEKAFAEQVALQDSGYLKAKAAYDREYEAVKNGTSTGQNLQNLANDVTVAKNGAMSNAKREWQNAANSANGKHVLAARKELAAAQRGMRASVSDPRHATRAELEQKKKVNEERIEWRDNLGANRRANRQNTFNSK